jgi:cobalt-zinc-cadmium resistance protein CzcA
VERVAKVFGDDTEELLKAGQKVAGVLTRVPGVEEVNLERIAGLPFLTIRPKREAISRYGLGVNEVQEIIEAAVGGQRAGDLFQGDRRFPIVVRLSETLRENLDTLKRIPVLLPAAEESSDSRAISVSGPNYIPLSEVQWGGQFEQLQRATKRLTVVVPVALILIFVLLFLSFGTATDALLIYTGVPLALTGGILALWFRGIPLSISAGVGFIALSGVAVLNGTVMIGFIRSLRSTGKPLYEAIRVGSLTRLRPVLMTALVASLGFVPMALATGRGAEVQRPLATVVIGGVISSMLTLLVLPVLYSMFHRGSKDVSV